MECMEKIKVGITGQKGFVGSHLHNYLGLKVEIELVQFEKGFFEDFSQLREFVSNCDVIVHLAAMNRHENAQFIYDTNVGLVNQLVAACEASGVMPHILFSSSTQEENDNLYGRSKREGMLVLEEWAKSNQTSVTGLVIPNVFGPFGKPFYNSVVATFCHQLTHDEDPQVNVDAEVSLIYVNELIEEIYNLILNPDHIAGRHQGVLRYRVPATYKVKVSRILIYCKDINLSIWITGLFLT